LARDVHQDAIRQNSQHQI